MGGGWRNPHSGHCNWCVVMLGLTSFNIGSSVQHHKSMKLPRSISPSGFFPAEQQKIQPCPKLSRDQVGYSTNEEHQKAEMTAEFKYLVIK